MDEVFAANRAELCGVVCETLRFSHESRGIRFYTFPLETLRLSGAADRLNIIVRDPLSSAVPPAGQRVRVAGELRSFNNRSGVGSRLVLTVYARELTDGGGEDENHILLTGTVCKEPNYRVTPMGREICDLMLAVNRRYGRSDYLPCIAWGSHARAAALWPVGTRVSLTGRIQSRRYMKLIDGESVEKTAYEVSVVDIVRDEG